MIGVAVALTAATPADAAITRAISDGGAFGDPRLAEVALGRAARAGARVARLPVLWARAEPGEAPRDATDPADAAYDFRATDALVRATVRHGLQPLVRISGGGPRRYEAPERWRYAAPGTWAPDPVAYGRFATAVAQRYSGTFADASGVTLPRVRLWQAGNEPNLPQFLQPQWIAVDGAWVAFSAPHYRRMLNAFYAGVKGVHRGNVVATAGTAPNGEGRDGVGRMTPVRFWQALLCLDTPCPDPPRFDVFAHHPLTVTDPDRPSRNAGDVTVADLYKLKRLLHAARRDDARIWITEINWDSGTRGATAEQLQRWVPRALYRLWAEGADLVAWQFVRDPPSRPGHPAGLYAIDRAAPFDATRDRPKRAAIRAFRFPFTGTRLDRGRIALWGLVPDSRRTRVAVQRRRGGRWVTVRHVTADRSGMVRATLTLRGHARLRLATKRRGASGTWEAPTGS